MLRRLLPLFLIALLAHFASAQTPPPWDRGISNAQRVIPLHGLPPGTRYQVLVDYWITSTAAAPVPLDLSSEIAVYVNGSATPAASALHELRQNGPIGNCTGGGANGYCNPAPCTVFSGLGGQQEIGQCYHPVDGGCDCGRILSNVLTLSGLVLHVGDLITVTIAPATGAAGEVDTTHDTFSFTIPADDAFATECSGNGQLATPCPCGNFGGPGHGCANSVQPLGALLGTSGSVLTDDVVLTGSSMPATATAIYLKSDGFDGSGAAFGDGLLCLTGNLIRLRTKINVGGASSFPEAGDPSLSQRGQTPPGSGLVGHYAVYYRNAAAFCTSATFNASAGVRIDW